MKNISLCIIGLGPWGLCTLERIFSRVRQLSESDSTFHIHMVEPSDPGSGVHTRDLPDYLLLNTKCGHVSMFVEDHFADIANPIKGPTLLEWAKLEGYFLAEDGFTLTKTGGREITDDDFLPRRLLGDYLHWFYQELLKNKPKNIECFVYRKRAVNVYELGPGETVELADGTKFFANYVVLTTGHTPNARDVSRPLFAGANESGRVIHVEYPIGEHLARIKPGDTVGISGFGLVAIDILATLTLGRGGRFIRDPISGHRKYLCSGREPRIFMFSRSGLPYLARPGSSKAFSSPRYTPSFFTTHLVEALQAKSLKAGADGRLNFAEDILPVMWEEMQLVYYQTQAQLTAGTANAEEVGNTLRRAWLDGSFKENITKLAKQYGKFDPGEIFFMDLRDGLKDSADYEEKLKSIMSDDLQESANGETGSARKAAFELFRELRDTIRKVVDFGGLTAVSHQQFSQVIAPLVSRVIVGPPKNRSEEVLNLLECGVVQAPFGPAPGLSFDTAKVKIVVQSTHLEKPYTASLDWVCLAFLDQPALSRTFSPLLENLFKKKRLQDFTHGNTSGSVQLSTDLHPINAAGFVEQRLWVLGPLAEGIKYFNNYIPSPKSRIKAFQEADLCILEILKREEIGRHSKDGTAGHIESIPVGSYG